jgi:hypothetical protein
VGKNKGFEKLKSPTLKQKLEGCSKLLYNKRTHFTARELGFNKLHQLSNKGDKRWKEYFQNNGKVYLKLRSVKESMCDRIIFHKSIKKYIGQDIPLPVKTKEVKREYVKGGKGGKVLGFNFYIQRNEKLLKKQRKILIEKGSDYISEVENKYNSHLLISNLDPKFNDLELMETWNQFYIQYGILIPEFKTEIENRLSKEYEKEYSKYEDVNKKDITPLKIEFGFNKKKPLVDMG